MKWLKQYWIIIVASVGVLVLIDIIIRVWFFKGYSLGIGSQNSTIFNNIFTPIVSLISALGVFATLIFLYKQNQQMRNDSLLPYFERKFLRVYEQVTELATIPEYPLPNGKIHFMKRIDAIYLNLETHDEYLSDLSDLNDGKTFNIGYIENRSYYKHVAFLNGYFIFKDFMPLEYAKSYLIEVINSGLSIEQIQLKKSEIKDVLLGGYMNLIENQMSRLIPVVYLVKNADKVEFTQLETTSFSDYYEFFKQELG